MGAIRPWRRRWPRFGRGPCLWGFPRCSQPRGSGCPLRASGSLRRRRARLSRRLPWRRLPGAWLRILAWLLHGSLLGRRLLAWRLLAAGILRRGIFVVPADSAARLRDLLVWRHPLLLCQRCVLHLQHVL